jgi:hypothetical protein
MLDAHSRAEIIVIGAVVALDFLSEPAVCKTTVRDWLNGDPLLDKPAGTRRTDPHVKFIACSLDHSFRRQFLRGTLLVHDAHDVLRESGGLLPQFRYGGGFPQAALSHRSDGEQ